MTEEKSEYGILSLQNEKGGGYGVPINFLWNGQSSIYLHCAPKGQKLRCIENALKRLSA